MTNYCTIEEAWSVPDFGGSNKVDQPQKQNTIETTIAQNNNANCYNNNFEHMENFQNYVVEKSQDMSSEEEEEDSSEEYYNNSFMPFNSNNNRNNLVLEKQNVKKHNVKHNLEKNNLEKHNEELKSVVEDLNKKMNFILDKMNSEERKPSVESKELENNVHDIVLFVLFGILVVMILDGFAKLVLKFAKKD